MKTRLFFLISLLWVSSLCAETNNAQRTIFQAVITGTLKLDWDGSVSEVTLNEPMQENLQLILLEEISSGTFHHENIEEEHFPLDVSFRFLARLDFYESGQLRSVDLGAIALTQKAVESLPEKAEVEGVKMSPPRYPAGSFLNGIGGTIISVIEVSPDGTVNRVLIESIFIHPHAAGDEDELKFIEWITASLSRTAAKWKFNPSPNETIRLIRVPVDFVPPHFPTQRSLWKKVWVGSIPERALRYTPPETRQAPSTSTRPYIAFTQKAPESND